MNNKSKFDAMDPAEKPGIEVDIKIAAAAFMTVPLNIIRIGINDESLANIFPVNFQNHF